MNCFICPKCSLRHEWHIELSRHEIDVVEHFDGGVWCRECSRRWQQMDKLRRSVESRHPSAQQLFGSVLLGFRLRRDRLP